jgi:hypothetical protein
MGVIGSSDMTPLAEMLPLGSNGCASGRGPAERSNKPPGIKTQIIVIQRQRWTSRATPPFSTQGQARERILARHARRFLVNAIMLLRIGPDMEIDYCL